MKKLILTIAAIVVILTLPKIAGLDYGSNHNYNGAIISENTAMHPEPDTTQKGITNNFSLTDSQTGTTFADRLKEYGLNNASIEKAKKSTETYDFTLKTENGEDLFAVYSAQGNLISTRQVLNNATLPASIKQKLSASIYKNWNIVDCKETVRYYHNQKSDEQNFQVTIANNNDRITLLYKITADVAEIIAKN